MNRLQGILAAGTLTGLIIITVLAFSWRDAAGQQGSLPAEGSLDSRPANAAMINNDGDVQAQIAGLQRYNEQLESAVQIYQAREAQYQQQIELANQALQQQTRTRREYEWEEHEHEYEDD